MSLVWWWSGEPLPPLKLWATGVAEPCSTIKAPLTLILTLPGCIMVLSISAVVVAVLGLPICSTSTAESWTAPAPRLVSSLVMAPATPGPDWAGIAWSPVCDGWALRSVMVPAYRRGYRGLGAMLPPPCVEMGLELVILGILNGGERDTGRCDAGRGWTRQVGNTISVGSTHVSGQVGNQRRGRLWTVESSREGGCR